MKFNFKEYEEQDLMCKGPMRRRYDELKENYKGYIIYKYIRGEYTRYSVEDDRGNIFVETDNLEEAREFIDNIDIISKTRKFFYKEVINEKYKQILTVAYKKINKMLSNN